MRPSFIFSGKADRVNGNPKISGASPALRPGKREAACRGTCLAWKTNKPWQPAPKTV
jgi:hypothetical protein